MNLNNESKSNKTLVNLIIVFLSLAISLIVIYGLSVLRGVLIPFVMASIIAYILYPIVQLFSKWKIPKWLSIAIIYVVFISTFLTIAIFQIPIIIDQLQQIITSIPSYIEKVDNFPDFINKWLVKFNVKVDVSPYTEYITQSIESLAQTALQFIGNSLTGIFSNALKVLLTVILSIYILADSEKIISFFRNIIFKNKLKEFDSITKLIHSVMQSYFKSMILLGLIVGFLSWLAAYIIGMNYSITIGFMVAIFDLIPVIGPLIAIGIAGIIALFQSPTIAFLVVCSLMGVQYIENQFLRPMIQGDSVGVHPLVIFFSLFLGASLWGVVGMFLSIPLAGILAKVFIIRSEEKETPNINMS